MSEICKIVLYLEKQIYFRLQIVLCLYPYYFYFISGTPPEWDSEIERVIGKPQSPISKSTRTLHRTNPGTDEKKTRGKFWVGDQSSQDENSSSVVFLPSSPGSRRELVEYSPNNSAPKLERAILFIQMEVCTITLR